MTSAKQNEIYRIFENISLVQSQLSSVNLDDKECPDSYAAWYWNDAALMESCKAGKSRNNDAKTYNLIKNLC
jgi:predicted transposase YbfD/YdcC